MPAKFRAISPPDLDVAYAVYLEAFHWLNARGIRQWLRAMPPEVVAERHQRGELHGCFIDGQLAAVVTLASEESPYWTDELPRVPRWWVKSLAVARRWSGHGIGPRVLSACEDMTRRAAASELYLDCVDTGFLPDYYARLGYVELARKDITYPSGNTFLVALMRKPLVT